MSTSQFDIVITSKRGWFDVNLRVEKTFMDTV